MADELAARAERPGAMCQQKQRARWQDPSGAAIKEVLMVRTAFRLIELSTCDVQLFKARHVIGRARP